MKRHSNNNSDGIDGGSNNKEVGMSRAAKKRAKKRAKTAAAAAAAAKTNSNVVMSADTSVGDSTIKDTTTSNKKLKIPLDDEEDDVLHAANSNNSIDKKKKKKKKSKKDKNQLNEDTEVNAFAIGDAAIATKSSTKMEVDDDADNQVINGIGDDVDDGDDDEMGPELEALLSTLTPMQILLLEKHNEDSDDDMKMPATSQTLSADSKEEPDDEEVQDNINNEEEGALAGISPIQIIGDLTTQHRAKILLSSIISPSGVTNSEFYESHWGKKPLLVCLEDDEDDNGGVNSSDNKKSTKQNQQNEELALQHATRLNGFLNRSIIDTMISRNKLRYGLDLNVTRFTDTMGNGLRHRITLDPEPKKRKNKGSSATTGDDVEYIVANPKDVWTNVDTSHCTVRLLRPHEHNDNIHSMLSLLESEFGCMVGSNAYLTPLNSQGFAPHYDDVDVFILQLEGYKRWRVYAPFNKRETLPRQSSRDYTEKEIEENGEEVLDVVLSPGDVLYLPRGWIHQAETVSRPSHMPKLPGIKDDHSLHLTVSAMQNWCWADFLEMLMPEALEGAASDKSTSLREGLPRNFLSYMGTMHQVDSEEGIGSDLPEGLKQVAEAQSMGEDEMDQEEARIKQRTLAHQTHFKSEAKKRIMRVCKQAMSMLDDACDQIGKRFLSDRLPPALLEPERCLTKEALSDSIAVHHHDAAKKIWPNTLCRLVRPGIARLVMEDDKAVLYHCLDNSRVYHGTPLSPMEFEIDDAPALEQLLTTVEPHWIQVSDLIHGDIEDKMEIAQALFDEGILATLLTDSPDRSVQTG